MAGQFTTFPWCITMDGGVCERFATVEEANEAMSWPGYEVGAQIEFIDEEEREQAFRDGDQ